MVASGRRRVNHITSLQVGDTSIQRKEDIKHYAMAFYTRLFTEEKLSISSFSQNLLPHISFAEMEALVSPFLEEDIRQTVLSLTGDKAPGPDGFSLVFFQQCWGIVKQDMVGAIQKFQEG